MCFWAAIPNILIQIITNITGVQILENSEEPEQVFQVEKVINHPHYQPNRVSKMCAKLPDSTKII